MAVWGGCGFFPLHFLHVLPTGRLVLPWCRKVRKESGLAVTWGAWDEPGWPHSVQVSVRTIPPSEYTHTTHTPQHTRIPYTPHIHNTRNTIHTPWYTHSMHTQYIHTMHTTHAYTMYTTHIYHTAHTIDTPWYTHSMHTTYSIHRTHTYYAHNTHMYHIHHTHHTQCAIHTQHKHTTYTTHTQHMHSMHTTRIYTTHTQSTPIHHTSHTHTEESSCAFISMCMLPWSVCSQGLYSEPGNQESSLFALTGLKFSL